MAPLSCYLGKKETGKKRITHTGKTILFQHSVDVNIKFTKHGFHDINVCKILKIEQCWNYKNEKH